MEQVVLFTSNVFHSLDKEGEVITQVELIVTTRENEYRYQPGIDSPGQTPVTKTHRFAIVLEGMDKLIELLDRIKEDAQSEHDKLSGKQTQGK